MAMALISTPRLPTRRLLDVLLRMAIISFRIPWQLPWSSTLLASTHDGVACSVTVHPHFPTIARVPRDNGGGYPSRQCFPFCVMSKFRIWGGMRPPRQKTLALRQHHPKGNRYDIPRSLREH